MSCRRLITQYKCNHALSPSSCEIDKRKRQGKEGRSTEQRKYEKKIVEVERRDGRERDRQKGRDKERKAEAQSRGSMRREGTETETA